MCSAIRLRITDIFSTMSPAPGANFGAGGRGASRDSLGSGCGGACCPSRSMYARMSSFVTRPAMPLPWIRLRSTLCSFAILRTSGDDRWRMASSVRGAAAGAGAGAGRGAGASAAAGAGSGAGRGGGAGRADGVLDPSAWGDGGGGVAGAGDGAVWAAAAGAAAASPAAPMTATTLLTGTVSPSFTRISATTPAAGDGISASTLSVEISKSGSSRSTLSPTFLIQRTIVPSAIDSPICGITTSVAIRPFRPRFVCPAYDVQRPGSRSDCSRRRPAPLQMYRRSARGVRRFADRLRHRRVSVKRADQLLDRGFELQRGRRFGDELRRARPDHVDPQQLVVFLLGHDLDEPFGFARHLGAPEHAERKRSDADVVAARFCFLLGQADAADLRVAVGACGDVVVIDRPRVEAGDPLRCNDAFGRRNMSQLRVRTSQRNDVADRGDAGDARSVERVDFDVALLHLQAHAFGVQTRRDRSATRGDQQVLGAQRLRLAIRELDGDVDAVTGRLRRGDLRAGVGGDALLAERLRELRRNGLVLGGNQTRQQLD